jgi:carbon-monoxide dehydrogenase large subunit
MDLLAADLRLDPAEVRRRNLIRGADFPYTTASGTVYDSGNLIAALDRVLKAGRYRTLREEQLRRRRNGDRERLGLGLAAFVDIAGRSSPPEFGAVEIATDGTLVIRAGCGPHGQGHGTVLATIASERLGGSLTARSRFVHSDTDEVPFGGGSYGSKSLQVAGSAVDNAAATLVERGRRLAAQVLEADSADVVLDLDAGAFHVAGARRPLLTWQDLAVAAAIRGERLYEEARLEGAGPTVPGGVYLAVVSLDVETWIARVLELITCDDAGRIVNPMLAEGQVQGGLVQGIAQALFEEQRYDSGGSLLTSTFLDYLIPTVGETPRHIGLFEETPTARNRLGTKGIGESGTVGATPAVVNAVLDALAEFGVRHLDMPLSPDRIWQALQVGRSSPGPPS